MARSSGLTKVPPTEARWGAECRLVRFQARRALGSVRGLIKLTAVEGRSTSVYSGPIGQVETESSVWTRHHRTSSSKCWRQREESAEVKRRRA